MTPLSQQERLVYDEFVKTNQLPVFYQSWWLDASCGPSKWSVVFAREKAGSLAAVWPFFSRPRLGGLLKTLDKPPFSLFCGPWINPAPGSMNPAKAHSRYHRIFKQLEAQLPQPPLRRAYLPYPIQNSIPAQKTGWKSRNYHSYRLRSDQQTPQQLWQQLDGKVRTDLKHYELAQQQIKPLKNVETLIQLQQKALDYRSSKVGFAHQTLTRLFNSANEQQQAIGWTFRNQQDEAIAAIWLPFDQQSAYLVMAASDPDQRSEYKAMTQLIWHAINYCCENKLIFDFEGSALAGVEEYYRSWGGEVANYQMLVHKRWSWLPG